MVNLEKIWIGKNRQLSPTIGQIADCHVYLLYCQVPKPFSSSTFVYLNCFRKHRIYICKLFLFLQILEKCESPPSHSHQQVMCRTSNLSERFYKHPRYAVNMRQTLLFRRIKNPLCMKKKHAKRLLSHFFIWWTMGKTPLTPHLNICWWWLAMQRHPGCLGHLSVTWLSEGRTVNRIFGGTGAVFLLFPPFSANSLS